MSDKLLIKKEVAKLLRVTERSIDEYRRRGVLPSYKLGGKILFNEKEVREAIKMHRRK